MTKIFKFNSDENKEKSESRQSEKENTESPKQIVQPSELTDSCIYLQQKSEMIQNLEQNISVDKTLDDQVKELQEKHDHWIKKKISQQLAAKDRINT